MDVARAAASTSRLRGAPSQETSESPSTGDQVASGAASGPPQASPPVAPLPARRMTLRTQFLLALGVLAALPVILFGLATSKTAEDTEIARADREALLASTSLARELEAAHGGSHAEVARSVAAEVARLGVVDAATLDERSHHYMAFFPGLDGAFYGDVAGLAPGGTLLGDGTERSMAGPASADREWFRQIRDGAAPVAWELLRSRVDRGVPRSSSPCERRCATARPSGSQGWAWSSAPSSARSST